MTTQVRSYSVDGVIKFHIDKIIEVSQELAEKSVRDNLGEELGADDTTLEIIQLNLTEEQGPHYDPNIDWEE